MTEEEEILVTGHELYKSLVEQGRNEGLRIGRQQGLRTLVRVVVRKLGRPLTEDELTTIDQRLDAVGPERLSDVVFDFDAEALAAWLADPQAR